MTYQEELADIFENDKPEYSYAHCISADFGMGLGIAVAFNQKFNCKNLLINQFGSLEENYDDKTAPLCVKTNRVYNLITKRNYWKKPTYVSFEAAIKELKELCLRDQVKTLIIPPLGCGLDKLSYLFVKTTIIKIFTDTNIDIICRTNDQRFANIHFH